MGWACGTNVGREERSLELTRNPKQKRRCRRFWRRLNDNIKMGIKEIE
jgi:hypothetical protein